MQTTRAWSVTLVRRTAVPIGLTILAALAFGAATFAKTVEVGPGKKYETVRALTESRTLKHGDVVEVDAAGEYCGDAAIWRRNDLTVRGVGDGRAHFQACGNSAGGKAIWVVRGANFTAENIEFSGAAVRDRNGAGIRLENPGQVTIRNCYFHDNQNGILGGGLDSVVLVENSVFERNGGGDGKTHNLYISHRVKKLVFQYNYSHGARVGHNLKSRAHENYVLYNRIMDETDGTASFQVDLPVGGKSYLIGNVIEQGPKAENFSLFAYANEAKRRAHPVQELYVINNTFVNNRPNGGRFIKITPSAEMNTRAVIRNNVFWGRGETWPTLDGVSIVEDHNFVEVSLEKNPGFADPASFDYRLTEGSPAVNAGVAPGKGDEYDLTPAFQYVRDARNDPRETADTIDIGAFEYSPSGR